ncbi:MAG: 6-hydroxymethylpterin diphosphokinase MptE-like protein [Leptospirales bacterium]
MDLFNKFSPETFTESPTGSSKENPGKTYYILADQKKIKCYTTRSLEREAKILKKKIQACPVDKKLIWAAPFHKKIATHLSINEQKRIFWISVADFTEPNIHIINSHSKWIYFLRNIQRTDSYRIEIHPVLKDFGLQEFFQHEFENSAVRIKTIEHFEKVWEYNFHRNRDWWLQVEDIATLKTEKPDAIVLGGPSVDEQYDQLQTKKVIWCADTSLWPLQHRGLTPKVVFSIDAGRGSWEHFAQSAKNNKIKNMQLVADGLGFPGVLHLGFAKTYAYAGTHPLVQKTTHNHTILENKTGDVYGIIETVYKFLFDENLPEVFGRDGTHFKYKTHLRGSGHYYRMYPQVDRFTTLEQYFYQLSRRYI